ncbi:sodium:solute symporter [Terriglobus saanensis]|uniref:SSS sodium solute transporter superfamily n=1 Tax=Terriglobus saanensis (strain ATCC BAA-1853 / DSM 23119 / SP1PR4) TaxID=401053 RepID=E8V3H8_TERSS|nr:sodium:solute symporter [Terriglobus saanensis]ADV83591.1 SSS sodium solute transporter superfamily [Terriglobus saanensis SP1PR4]
MRPLDLVVLGIYMAALVGIGLHFARRQTTTESYFTANRSIPGWAMGMSLLATIITSVTFIAYPGAAYAGDWSLLVPGIMFVAILILIGSVVVPFFRHVVHMSTYEYFGRRFGKIVRLYSSLAFAIGHFSKMGFVFYLLALTISSMTGWNVNTVIIGTALITIFYTMLGGVEAVVWSDVVQGFVLWTGIIVSIAYLLFLPRQGPHAVLADAWSHGKMSLGSTSLNLDKPTILVLAIYGFFFYLQKYTADQTVVQRYLIAKTDRSALRGMFLGASLCLPVWTAFMLIGSLLWSFYRLTGESIPKNLTRPDQVFPHFLITHIPSGLAGLFVAALLGSAMAMLASDMNCLSTIGVEDFYFLARPQSTDKERLRMGRLIVVFSGLAAGGVALRLAHSQGGALSLYYTITAIVAGGLAGLFLLAFLIRKANRVGALAGIFANLLFTIWATLTLGGKTINLGRFNFPWHDYMIGAIGHLILFGFGVVFSFFFPRSKPIAEDLTLWGWRELRLSRTQSEATAATATQVLP